MHQLIRQKMNIVLNRRVEHFAIFENLVFAITSKMLRILTDHIENVCILDSKLLLITICFIRILNNFERKNEFYENRKMRNSAKPSNVVARAIPQRRANRHRSSVFGIEYVRAK